MTNGYTKVFSTILASSVWAEDDQTRLVWITMLVLMDANGVVKGSVPGLAHFARVPTDACRKALDRFLAPDPHSTSTEHEGRRISQIDGVGWQVLNAGKYSEMMSRESRRAYWRDKKNEARMKERQLTDGSIRDLAHMKQSVEDRDSGLKGAVKMP